MPLAPGPRANYNPIFIIDTLIEKQEKEAIDACKDLQRDISREQIYSHFLQRFFDLKGYVSPYIRINGGWMNLSYAPRGRNARSGSGSGPGPGGQHYRAAFDVRYAVLTSDHHYSWNIYHALANARYTRKMPLDELMLPYRSQELLRASNVQQQDNFEKIATDNRALYEQYLLRNTRTRTPLLVTPLDHYFFIFSYWAHVKKRDTVNRPREYYNYTRRSQSFEYDRSIAEGRVTPNAIISDPRGCYFELVKIYVQNNFPRDVPALSSNRLDVERALRMTGEADHFLRIMIEMWLERNSVVNPECKAQAEPTDAENQLLSGSSYDHPTKDCLLGLTIMVTYLLARKAEVDVASQCSRTARIIHLCPALQTLHQPMFIYLVLAFRCFKTDYQWTEFFLAVNLWLVWLDPSRAMIHMYGESAREKAVEWRKGQLKAYVTSNLHFYTSLFVLFMRKAREALGSDDPGRKWLVLLLVRRVLKVFQDHDLGNILKRNSEIAAQLWEYGNNLRGREYLMLHLRLCRLTRSRPCLMHDACQDAHHLGAEVQALRLKASEAVEASRGRWKKWTFFITQKVQEFINSFGNNPDESAGMSGGYIEPAELVKTIDDTLEAIFDVFPQVRQRCRQPMLGKDAFMQRDAERDKADNLLLTAQGREQLLAGIRGCDPTKVRFLGDPLFNPEIGEYEIEWSVRLAQKVSVWLSEFLYRDYRYDAAGAATRTEEIKHEGGHLDVQRKAQIRWTPVNLRPWVDIRVLRFLLICLVMIAVLKALAHFLQYVGDNLPVI